VLLETVNAAKKPKASDGVSASSFFTMCGLQLELKRLQWAMGLFE
jgi:hypothetical protein